MKWAHVFSYGVCAEQRENLEAEADALADNLNSPGPNGEVEVCVIHCVIVYSLYLIYTYVFRGAQGWAERRIDR